MRLILLFHNFLIICLLGPFIIKISFAQQLITLIILIIFSTFFIFIIKVDLFILLDFPSFIIFVM